MSALRSIWEFIELMGVLLAALAIGVVGAVFILLFFAILSPLWLMLALFVVIAGPSRLKIAIEEAHGKTSRREESEDKS